MSEAVPAINFYGAHDVMAARTSFRVGGPRTEAHAAAAAEEFVQMFMAQMLQPMFEGVEANALFGGGHGEEMMRVFLVQEYGKAVAKGSGGMLADAVKSEIIRLQSQTDNVGAGGPV